MRDDGNGTIPSLVRWREDADNIEDLVMSIDVYIVFFYSSVSQILFPTIQSQWCYRLCSEFVRLPDFSI